MSNGAMSYCSRSARCDALLRSARIPPCTFGCSVTTRWSSMSGKPVNSRRCDHRDAGLVDRARGARRRHELPAELVQAAGEVDEPGLVPDREQRAHQASSSVERAEHLRVETSLHFLDPLLQRLDGVVVEDAAPPPGRGSGRRRPRARAMCTVQPVTFTPAASASSTACQPLNAGSSAGMRVDDAVGKCVVDRLLEDRAEARPSR